jgi:hypothetical protein
VDTLSLTGHGAAIQLNYPFMERLFNMPNMSTIKHLSIGSVDDPISARGIRKLFNGQLKFPQLKTLKLGASDWLYDETLALFITACPAIASLHISDHVAAEGIVHVLPRNLCRMSINPGTSHSYHLLQCLPEFTNLRHLVIGDILQASSKSFRKLSLPNLVTLDLYWWSFQEFDIEDWSQFASSSLCKIKHVTFAMMVHDRTQQSGIFLTRYAKYLKNISYLDISGGVHAREAMFELQSFQQLQTFVYGDISKDESLDEFEYAFSVAADIIHLCTKH